MPHIAATDKFKPTTNFSPALPLYPGHALNSALTFSQLMKLQLAKINENASQRSVGRLSWLKSLSLRNSYM